MKDNSSIKQELLEACKKTITERIGMIKKNLESVRESRNNETKSSAGDKFETARAMLQIEEDNYQKQLHQALLLKNQLEQIKINSQTGRADLGSLVITGKEEYFISIGLGEITLGDKSYYCISPASPIGQKIMKQHVGFQFNFNGRDFEIKEIL
jgi:hypothetical protein